MEIKLYALVYEEDGKLKQSFEMYNHWFHGVTARYKPLIYDTHEKAERAMARINNKSDAWLPEGTRIIELVGK